MIYFIGVCRGLGIDYFAIWDKDDDCGIEDRFESLRTSLNEGA